MNPKPNAEATDPAQARNAWLSVKDAAAALGVSARTVRRRIERGELAGAMSPLDGGGRAWLVSLSGGDDVETGEREDSERTANGQRAAKRTDSAAKRSNKREIGRTDSVRTACGQASGQANGQRADSARPSERTGDAMPMEREPTRREIEQQEEIRFLRGTIEQLQRDGAEVRAALRAALKLAAPSSALQLTAGDGSGDVGAAPLDAATATTPAPDRAQFKPLNPTTGDKSGATPITYDSIADEIERNLKARGLEKP